MANHDEQPQSWRDRLFGENRVEAVETPEAPEATDESSATEPSEENALPEKGDATAEEVEIHEEQQRAWQAAFDNDDSVATAEYRPSPASAPAPDAEVEPQVVLPSSLRGDNPTGEMDTATEGESPELVEPERPQLSLRRRARAIEDAKEAERVVSGDDDDAPLSEVVQRDAASLEETTAVIPESVPEPEPEAAQESTRVFDATELVAENDGVDDSDVSETFVEQQVIQFVEEPEEPRKRGARGTGVWVALLSTVVFTGLLGLLFFGLYYLLIGPTQYDPNFIIEVWTLPYVVFPAVAFLVAYLLFTLIVNRAGWWAHVLGGFLVAIVVYAATVLGFNFDYNGGWEAGVREIFTFTGAGIREGLFSAFAVVAFVLAREVPIWLGGIVARRGRKQRQRYENEMAEHRERYSEFNEE